jgi:mono/diheme cytochrome c family protein
MITVFRVNLVLGAALIACILLIYQGRRDLSQPNVQYMPDMAISLAYESFAPNPIFPDGKTLQRPPAGTVARGQLPLRYEAGKAEAERAGRELRSPLDLFDPDIQRLGAGRFGTFCQPCHGAGGKGDGPIAQRGFPPPPSLLAAQARDIVDGRMFHILTFGQGNMPGHASQISRVDRWRIIAHVRKLQASDNVDSSGAQPSTDSSEEAGS